MSLHVVFRLQDLKGWASARLFYAVRFLGWTGLFLLLFHGALNADEGPIRSACEMAYPPFYVMDANGNPDGFSVELFRAAMAAMNREINFQVGTWPEVRQWLEEGSIQALPLVGRTPERESLFDFTFPYISLHAGIAVREGGNDIVGLDDLKNKRVLVLPSSSMEEYLRREMPEIDIHRAVSLEAALREVAEGRYDALVSQRLSILRTTQEFGLSNLKVIGLSIEALRHDFCFAVREGDRETLALLNEGLATVMADGSYQQLHAKWFAGLELPSSDRIVVGGDHNYPPFEYLNSLGRPAGYCVDMTWTIAREMGLNVEYRLGPWEQIIQEFEEGKIDVIQGMFYSSQRDLKYDFTQPYLVSHYVGVTRKNNGKPPSVLSELVGKSIVVQRGDVIYDYLLENGISKGISLVETQEDVLRELAEGKHDCGLAVRISSLYLIEQRGWNNLMLGRKPFISMEYCYATLSNHKVLLAQFSEGLNVLHRNGEHHRIHDKWLGVYHEETPSFWVVLQYSGMIMIPLVLILIAASLWSWFLQRQVAEKTRSLRESLERFQYVFEAENVGKSITLQTGEIQANQSFADFLGYSQEELKRKTWMELTPIEHVERSVEQIAPLLTGNSNATRFEKPYLRKDGCWVWGDVNITVRRDKEGRLQDIITTTVDITERKKAEESLARQLRCEKGVTDASTCLLKAAEGNQGIRDALIGLRNAVDVARVYIFENFMDSKDGLCLKHRYEACAPGVQPELDNPVLQHVPYKNRYERWQKELAAGNSICGQVTDFPEEEHTLLKSQGIVSILVLPLFAGGEWWGMIGFDETRALREWHPDEVLLLGTAADLISSQLTKMRAEEEIQRNTECLKAVVEVLQYQSGNVQDFLDCALSHAVALTGSKFGYIYFYYENRREFVLNTWSRDVMDECAVANPSTCYELDKTGIWGEAVRQRKPIVLNDFQAEHPLKKGYPQGHVQLTRFLTVPVFYNEQIVAVVGVANKPSNYIKRDELALILLMDAVWKSVETMRSEEALRRNEEFQRVMIACSPVALYSIDLKGNVLTWNPSAERMFGWMADEVVGRPLPIVQEAKKDEFDDLRALVMSGKEIIAKELIRQRKGGTLFPISLSVSPMRNEKGEMIGIISAVKDITERKKAEEERENLQLKLIQSQRMESVGRLAGGVAHDFNNILQAMMGYSEMLIRQLPEGEEPHEYAREIMVGVKRATTLTRQLLAFARRQTIQPKPLDLNDAVESILKMLRRLIGEDIELAWMPQAGLWTVKMDPSQIDQILANLCINARDAINGVGRIVIGTANVSFDAVYCADHMGSIPGDFVLLTISDNGCGMDKETQEHIFEPFFTTKGLHEGTGLGLATVYGIVTQNEGFVNVYSEIEQGTTLKIYLPRFTGGVQEQNLEKPKPVRAGNGETILFVEDDLSILTLGKRMLEHMGYSVFAANKIGEALDWAREHKDDLQLLVTDVVMPEMNGHELANQLRSFCPGIKTLYMSGYTANVIAHRGVLDEGTNFIQKPFSRESLAAKVREVLDQ